MIIAGNLGCVLPRVSAIIVRTGWRGLLLAEEEWLKEHSCRAAAERACCAAFRAVTLSGLLRNAVARLAAPTVGAPLSAQEGQPDRHGLGGRWCPRPAKTAKRSATRGRC